MSSESDVYISYTGLGAAVGEARVQGERNQKGDLSMCRDEMLCIIDQMQSMPVLAAVFPTPRPTSRSEWSEVDPYC